MQQLGGPYMRPTGMQRNVRACGTQHDEKGSATALLHLCVKVSEKRFLFFFACLGDTEASR